MAAFLLAKIFTKGKLKKEGGADWTDLSKSVILRESNLKQEADLNREEAERNACVLLFRSR